MVYNKSIYDGMYDSSCKALIFTMNIKRTMMKSHLLAYHGGGLWLIKKCSHGSVATSIL